MNNIERGNEKERQALLALASLGWLTTPQLGRWLLPDSDKATQVVQAKKLMYKLEQMAQVTRRKNARGHTVWVLNYNGAARVRCDEGVPASDGTGLNTEGCNARHDWTTDALIDEHCKGRTAIGAAGIRNGYGDFKDLQGLDGAVVDPYTGNTYGLICLTNAHAENVERYRRLSPYIELRAIGEDWAVAELKRQLRQHQRA